MLLALSEPKPRMRMAGALPGSPEELVADTPATLPTSALVAVEVTRLVMSSLFTSTAEPVKADFLAVP